MPVRQHFVLPLVLLLASHYVAAQAHPAPASKWFAISGGFGPASGAGYRTIAERTASIRVAFPTKGHYVEVSALGAWYGHDVFCDVSTDSSCGYGGPTSFAGAAVSVLAHALASARESATHWSVGIGAYRLPNGFGNAEPRGGIFPAVQAGAEKPLHVGDGFAIIAAAHVVVLPEVRGRPFFFLPLTLGYRAW